MTLLAEKEVIAAILEKPERLADVADLLAPDDFTDEVLALTFQTMNKMAMSDESIDIITVTEKHSGISFQYIAEIMRDCFRGRACRSYAEIIKQSTTRHKFQQFLHDASAELNEPGRQFVDVLAESQSNILEIGKDARADYESIGSGAEQFFKVLEEREANPGARGLGTGFTDLDKLIIGMQPGDFWVVAGRPSMGKTAFAINVSLHASRESTVAFFSLEMATEQLRERAYSDIGKVPLQDIKRGKNINYSELNKARYALEGRKLFVLDDVAANIAQIASRAQRIKHKHGLDLVVVDYLQLITPSRNTESRTVEIEEISRACKVMAKNLKVPVMVLSQLNRGLENRPDKRPMLSDLRQSGAIEQDADGVIFLYRDEVYYPSPVNVGHAEAIIGKNRNGPTGTVALTWQGEYTRFTNAAYGTPVGAKAFKPNQVDGLSRGSHETH